MVQDLKETEEIKDIRHSFLEILRILRILNTIIIGLGLSDLIFKIKEFEKTKKLNITERWDDYVNEINFNFPEINVSEDEIRDCK